MHENREKKTQPMKRIAIVGLPNTGKSQVFNFLTGQYNIVANYPLTTVEIKKARCTINDQTCEVYDTPGLHSLYIHSEEEIVVRDMLFSERPDILIQCIDANQLKQSLVLTADLMELGIPMAVSLNAMDETANKGIEVNSGILSQILHIPVVELFGLQDRGKEKLNRAIEKVGSIAGTFRYSDTIENMISDVEPELPLDMYYKRKTAVLLLQNDTSLVKDLKKGYTEETVSRIQEKVNKTRNSFSGDIGRSTNKQQGLWVDAVYKKVVKTKLGGQSEFLRTFAHLSRHPLYGIPILLFFLAVTYLLVVHVAGFLEGMLSTYCVDPVVEVISEKISSGLLREFLIGDYGILTLGLFNAICTVLPILSVFFFMFGALEDIGYIPNLCVLTNRLFRKIGITGKSIMSLVLGFGCKTMATLTARGLQSRKEKFIAIYLIAFAIPCSAQLGLNMAILGKMGVAAFVIAFSALIIVEVLAGAVLNKVITEDKQSDFIQELPPIRIPNIRAIVIKTYYRLLWFLKEAVPIFLVAAVFLFLFDKSGGLGMIKKLLGPIVINWLGLPLDMIDALILTMARHEAAAGLILKMVNAGSLNYVQCIVAVVITTMFVPCFANIVAMCKEMGIKTGIVMAVVINITSFILAGILNWILLFTFGG